MTDKEILLDLLEDFAGSFWWTIHKLSLDALRWQPDAEANSIAIAIWHVCRSFDVLNVRALQNRPTPKKRGICVVGSAKQATLDYLRRDAVAVAGS